MIALTDFFTNYDSSISLPLERDPLGLQPIWTSLGNQIFSGAMTSVADDIRNYTINLVHHAVIIKLKEDHSDFWTDYKTKAGSDAEAEARIILALEMLLAYSFVANPQWENTTGILGISSARKRWERTDQNNKIDLTKQPVDPKLNDYEGFVTLLVRQAGLGINGRYKGPFRKMELLEKSGCYKRKKWEEARIFDELKVVYKDLINALVESIFASREQGFKLELKRIQQYEIFDKSRTKIEKLWLSLMGLKEGVAAAVYQSLVKNIEAKLPDEASLIFSGIDGAEVDSIVKVEKLLTLVEYAFAVLLQTDKQIPKSMLKAIQHAAEDVKKLKIEQPRLKKIVNACSSESFVNELIEYHKNIAKEREIHPWLIAQGEVFKKVEYIEQKNVEELLSSPLDKVETLPWRRDYYLSSLASIHRGFA